MGYNAAALAMNAYRWCLFPAAEARRIAANIAKLPQLAAQGLMLALRCAREKLLNVMAITDVLALFW